MELLPGFFTFVTFFKSLLSDNPALLDILKVIIGSSAWIGGMVVYMYLRDKKLKAAVINR